MTPTQATTILHQCGLSLTVTATYAMQGGMVSHVEEWITDGAPRRVVAKIIEEPDDGGMHGQYLNLRWFRENTNLPVPQAYGYVSGEIMHGGACLVIERLPGANLADAQLTAAGCTAIQHQMAECIARLHTHHQESYGDIASGETYARWLDWFGPRIRENYSDTYTHLSPGARTNIEALLDSLEEWLPECGTPTLVHGDLWNTNIIVDDTNPIHPRITGFIDVGGVFADVEYELAYLLVFNTANEDFFDVYTHYHPLRDGFSRRCRVYWLNTMLLHLWLFGEEYLPECERLAEEIGHL